ncbi:hypothetical protein COCC4DRAFT_32636 [Bipolaris maydis ATCC 48331]|uniref:Uncharacterized protein n=2 Tax=Cochliobolus heterostrophus TaxID=5016 RepID=M2UU32_COCH5|nr:uncharacterized protein COCC4DRAFT_32636 [Bipolaris maydis ATCC 48331]EMD97096.1 hypothetical protein COCHEDRAFT_1018731 [Bipolaris maydis C5]ENI04438.1 hypothetical protein COCC4DRAFT_32636 [Bipolaris maydis ATCC 48331]
MFGRGGVHNRRRVPCFLFRTGRGQTGAGQFQTRTRYSFALGLMRYRFAPGCTTISMDHLSNSYITRNYFIDAGK